MEGILTTIVSPTEFRIVVSDEPSDVPELEVGSIATVAIQNGATFEVESSDLPVPPDLSFNGPRDLLAGQVVHIRVLPSSSGPIVKTDRVRLRMSRLTAKVKTVDPPNLAFTVNHLPTFLASANPAVKEIQARVVEKTEYEEISGVPVLVPGDTVTLRGLLYKTTGLPGLIVRKVRKRTEP